MRSIEDKGCLNYKEKQEISSGHGTNFEFQRGNGKKNHISHHRSALGKPTPSKWDDAQKWLVNLSRGGEKNHSKTSTPRSSNADDRRLIAPVPKEEDYSSGDNGEEGNEYPGSMSTIQCGVETKNVDSGDQSIWRINKPVNKSTSVVVRSVCVRDMGTEMTPIASQEPSRTPTPVRATTPAARSPISSRSSTPIRCQNRVQALEGNQTGRALAENIGDAGQEGKESNGNNAAENTNSDLSGKLDPLETRALAWDEAERAKYTARYKREEVKIQAWENNEKRKAEMEMKKMEVKAEKLKSQAQERYTNKLTVTKRIAEEKRANAKSKLNEKAMRASERADYIRRTGHLPSSFSFKLPSFCW